MRTVATIIILLWAGSLSAAQFDCSLKPPPQRQQDRLVLQYGEPWLKPNEVERLNAKLATFARETSNQILVLVVDTLCGYPESDLAFAVGEQWGLGKKGFDNGIVFLVKPFGKPGDRALFIAVGYGLEAVIPDLTAKRIVDREAIPHFQEGRYFQGVDQATDVLMGLAKGEFDQESYGKQATPWPVLIFFLFIIVVMVLSWRKGVKSYATRNNIDFWTAMWLMSQMQQKHGRRGGGFGGGMGRMGGGGGFGGFGGGGFGGGGAGGRW